MILCGLQDFSESSLRLNGMQDILVRLGCIPWLTVFFIIVVSKRTFTKDTGGERIPLYPKKISNSLFGPWHSKYLGVYTISKDYTDNVKLTISYRDYS